MDVGALSRTNTLDFATCQFQALSQTPRRFLCLASPSGMTSCTRPPPGMHTRYVTPPTHTASVLESHPGDGRGLVTFTTGGADWVRLFGWVGVVMIEGMFEAILIEGFGARVR